MHQLNKRGQNEEKNILQFEKNIFSLVLFFGCSFGFAFQRWFVKLEKALLLQHFKSLKMEKIWKRFTKMFNDKLMFDDEPIYPSPPLAFHKQKFDLMGLGFRLNCTNMFSNKKIKIKIKDVNFYIITLSAFCCANGYETK